MTSDLAEASAIRAPFGLSISRFRVSIQKEMQRSNKITAANSLHLQSLRALDSKVSDFIDKITVLDLVLITVSSLSLEEQFEISFLLIRSILLCFQRNQNHGFGAFV